MTIYKTNGLTSSQKYHKAFFEAPKGSLMRWPVNKIDYLYQNESVKVNLAYAQTMRRVIAAAMPIFAIADGIQFAGKSLFHLVTLKPHTALDDLIYSIKTIILTPATIFCIPAAVSNPKSIYRSERMWREIMKSQVEKGIKEKFEEGTTVEESLTRTPEIPLKANPKAKLEKALKHYIETMVADNQAKTALNKIREQVIQEIPEDLDKQEIVINQYIELFTQLLVSAASKEVPLHEAKDDFVRLAEQIIKLRKPELRLKLVESLLDTFLNEKDTYDAWLEIKNTKIKNEARQSIPLFIACHITDDAKVLDRLLKTTEDTYFKSRINTAEMISALADRKSVV